MDPSGKREESKAMASDREEQRRNYTFSVPLKRLSDVPNDTPDPSKSIDARECAARFCEETLGISANEVNLQAVLQSLPLSHRSHTVAYKAKGAMANQARRLNRFFLRICSFDRARSGWFVFLSTSLSFPACR